MNPDSIAQYFLLASIIVDASLGWFILFRNPKNATHQSYFFLVCSITLWQVTTYVGMFFLESDHQRVIAFRLIYAAIISAVMWLLYFINMFGAEEHRKFWFRAVVVSIVGAGIITVLTPALFTQARIWAVYTGLLYPYVIFVILGLIAALFASAIHRLLTVSDQRIRVQLEYMVLGLFIPILFGAFSTIILPFIQNEHTVLQFSAIGVFGAATTCCFSFMMAYAMVRHRLMDVRIALSRKTIAGMLTLCAVLGTAGAVLFALRDNLQLNPGRVITAVLIGGVCVVLMYEIILQTVEMFMKRGVVSLAAYTSDEQTFLRKIESPGKWARRLAGTLQKQFGVEGLECITYDHRAQCWKQVFPECKIKYALDEKWIEAVQNPEKKIYTIGDTEACVAVETKLQKLERAVLIAMHDHFRCMGLWTLGKKLDGSSWCEEDYTALEAFARRAEKELWYVMQSEHTLITAMEDGAELPPELLNDTEE